jgi:tetratricopeptide (TPR) repeat protein
LITILINAHQWERALRFIDKIDDNLNFGIEERLRTLLEGDDEDIDALFYLGEQAYLRKQERLSNLLEGDDEDIDALFDLGEQAYLREQERLSNLLEKDDKDLEFHFGLEEQAYLGEQVQDEALEALLQAFIFNDSEVSSKRDYLYHLLRRRHPFLNNAIERKRELLRSIRFFEMKWMKVQALRELGRGLAEAQEWRRAEIVWAEAEAIIRIRKENLERATLLRELGKALIQAGQQEKAKLVWNEAAVAAKCITNFLVRIATIYKLCQVLTEAQQWEEAKTLIYDLPKGLHKEMALDELGRTLILAQQWEQAEVIIQALQDRKRKAEALKELGRVLILAQQWEQAEVVIQALQDRKRKAEALLELGQALAKVQQLQRAEAVWMQAKEAIFAISGNLEWIEPLCELIIMLYQIRGRFITANPPKDELRRV